MKKFFSGSFEEPERKDGFPLEFCELFEYFLYDLF